MNTKFPYVLILLNPYCGYVKLETYLLQFCVTLLLTSNFCNDFYLIHIVFEYYLLTRSKITLRKTPVMVTFLVQRDEVYGFT